ncbi:glycosyltransferase family A protein [Spirochaetia bacterium 38H-sp]|uniref:Glycosyltransferase family A protein n=1 Tax=Rarispira pelagica TaxID=3141764 RepID=A0ABU9UA96_9SPIR
MTVSVVIPVYNRRELLTEALSSVYAQDKPDNVHIEVIVADDGSTDGSGELAEQYGAKHIRINHCGMPGKVRNIGVEKSSGDVIAFLDSDDIWESCKIAVQLSVFEKAMEKGVPLVHTREKWMRDGRELSQSKQRHKREGNIFPDALVKCIIGPSTTMISKEVFIELGGFREDLEVAEDYELWLRLTDRYDVDYVDEPLTIKRAGNWEQLSEKYGQIEIFRIQALQPLVDASFFTEKNQYLATLELIRKLEIYATGAEKRGKKELASEYREKVNFYKKRLTSRAM